MWETWVRSLGWKDPLEKGTATHSSILAWGISQAVQSMESQRGGLLHFHVFYPVSSVLQEYSWAFGLAAPSGMFFPGSLVGHSPWGHKELDMTEQLSLHFTFQWS